MGASLDIVLPVLNEERALADSVAKLEAFLSGHMEAYDWRIVIADNGSTDATPEICQELVARYRQVGFVRLEQRGRGRALKKAWTESQADIVSYMDLDLSTDLAALPPVVDAIGTEGYDVAIGSRLMRGAQVIGRSTRREVMSRSYSLIFRVMFLTGFLDAQCGFKALSRRAVTDVIPLVRDTGWFFDTELLILAGKNGYRIKEVPVRWTDDPDTRVRVVRTAYEDLKGLFRLRFGGLRRASRVLSARDPLPPRE